MLAQKLSGLWAALARPMLYMIVGAAGTIAAQIVPALHSAFCQGMTGLV